MSEVIPRTAPVVAFARSEDEVYYLCSEVAAGLGVSPTMLRRLAREDPQELAPSSGAAFGANRVALYRMEDVVRIRKDLLTRWPDHDDGRPRRRPGRPRLWSDGERRDRQRRHRAACYWRTRSRDLADHDPGRAAEAQARAEKLTEDLRREHAERVPRATAPRRTLSYAELERSR